MVSVSPEAGHVQLSVLPTHVDSAERSVIPGAAWRHQSKLSMVQCSQVSHITGMGPFCWN